DRTAYLDYRDSGCDFVIRRGRNEGEPEAVIAVGVDDHIGPGGVMKRKRRRTCMNKIYPAPILESEADERAGARRLRQSSRCRGAVAAGPPSCRPTRAVGHERAPRRSHRHLRESRADASGG